MPDDRPSDPADPPVRIGLLGAGLIAGYHAVQLNVAAVPNRIVAVHDPDPGRATALAAGQGAEVTDEAGVIEASDAVFICTWTSEHLRLAEAAARAGRPVFCEKPLGTDLAGARAVTAALAPVPAMVGLVLRSTPALLGLREMVRDPAAGRVMNVVFRDDQYLPTQGMYASTWRGDPALAGSGVLLEHSIHDLDIIEWLFGEVDSVAALQGEFHGISGIEDSVALLARLSAGGSVSLTTVWHDVLSRPSQRRVEVFCERATLTLEGEFDGPLRRETSDGEEVLEGDALRDWLTARDVDLRSAEEQFLTAVAAHLRGEAVGRLDPDPADALRAHVLADAVYRSAGGHGDQVAVPAARPRG
ncbi:MAG: Gfo/Idh/MocA family protein [Microthrixaceae bacterium]